MLRASRFGLAIGMVVVMAAGCGGGSGGSSKATLVKACHQIQVWNNDIASQGIVLSPDATRAILTRSDVIYLSNQIGNEFGSATNGNTSMDWGRVMEAEQEVIDPASTTQSNYGVTPTPQVALQDLIDTAKQVIGVFGDCDTLAGVQINNGINTDTVASADGSGQ